MCAVSAKLCTYADVKGLYDNGGAIVGGIVGVSVIASIPDDAAELCAPTVVGSLRETSEGIGSSDSSDDCPGGRSLRGICGLGLLLVQEEWPVVEHGGKLARESSSLFELVAPTEGTRSSESSKSADASFLESSATQTTKRNSTDESSSSSLSSSSSSSTANGSESSAL